MRSKQTKPRKDERNDQLVRALEMITVLDRSVGMTVYELAEHFAKSTKTIGRDIKALQGAHLPIDCEMRGKRKVWRVDIKKHWKDFATLIDASHYLALRVAMEPGAAVGDGTPLWADLDDLARKIEQAVGPAGKARLTAIETAFFSYEKRRYEQLPPDILWPLVQAIGDRRLCRVTYRAPSETPKDKTYDVLPLRLFAYDGAMYLLCHTPKFGSILKLNLQRLQRMRVLKRTARPPRDFDPAAIADAAFGLVAGGERTTYRLRFASYLAPFIRERRWHPSQKLAERDDGAVDLTFTCDASYEVEAWVQSWGEGVEVLAPASLRARMREVAEALLEMYPARERRGKQRRATAA